MKYPDIIEEIKKFAEEIRIDVKYLLGERYESYLWLASAESLPDNIVFNVSRKIQLPTSYKVKVIWN